MLAGVGRGQLEVIEDRVRQRRNVHFYYKEILRQYEGITFLEEPDASYFSNHWLTAILIDPAKTGRTREFLQTELGIMNIESRPLWKPMHLQPVFSSYPAYLNGNSEKLFNRGMCLPSGSNMSINDLERISDILNCCLTKGRPCHKKSPSIAVSVAAN